VSEGTTQTVSSVTLPAGAYMLSGRVAAVRVSDSDTHLSCYFVSAGTLNGHAALASMESEAGDVVPLIGDVTIVTNNTSVFLRCSTLDDDVDAVGEMIATNVGAITPSS
jgi:hypothetical protein